MGARTAVARAFTLHDSDRWHVSLEFSLAAIFPSRTCNLRGGGAAAQAGVSDPRYSGAWTRRFDKRGRVDLPHDWFLRFPAHLDFCWIDFGLGLFGIHPTSLPSSTLGTGRDHLLRVARHVCLHSDKLRSSQIQFFSRTPQACTT